MTSRREHKCPKTMKPRPCSCSKPGLWKFNLFRMENRSFVPVSLHSCWPREKRLSIAIRNRICAVSYSILSHFRKLIRLRNKQVKIIDSAGQNKQVGNQKGLLQRKNGAFLPT